MIYGDLQDKMMQACEATSAPVRKAPAASIGNRPEVGCPN